jgi:hypothetical protein
MTHAGYTFFRRLGLWTVICTVSALPSFLLAIARYDAIGMICGLVLFILLYSLAFGTDYVERLQRRPFVRSTLRIGFGTRLALSAFFPVGWLVDLFPGLISVTIGERLFDEPTLFIGTFTTTLIQGALASAVLALFMGFVYFLHLVFAQPPRPDGACRTCGYNLTGNVSGICPECGEPIPADVLSRVQLAAMARE